MAEGGLGRLWRSGSSDGVCSGHGVSPLLAGVARTWPAGCRPAQSGQGALGAGFTRCERGGTLQSTTTSCSERERSRSARFLAVDGSVSLSAA